MKWVRNPEIAPGFPRTGSIEWKCGHSSPLNLFSGRVVDNSITRPESPKDPEKDRQIERGSRSRSCCVALSGVLDLARCAQERANRGRSQLYFGIDIKASFQPFQRVCPELEPSSSKLL
jgi:hypothetical protein